MLGGDGVHTDSFPFALNRYMLSDAGRKVAEDCLARSGMLDSAQNVVSREESSDSGEQDKENVVVVSADSPTSADLNRKKSMEDDIHAEFIERVL